MAIAFASVGTIARTGAGTSVSPGAPSGVATGDLLVINACVVTGSNTVNTPTGWTLIKSQIHQFTAARSYMFYRIADGTADDTPAVTCTSSNTLGAVICRITGASATPLDTSWSGQDSEPIDIPDGTIAENGSLIVAMVGAASSSSGPSITAGTYTIQSGHTSSPTLATLSDAVDSGSDGAGTLDYSSPTIRYAYIAAAFKPATGAGIRNPLFGPVTLRNPLGRFN